MKNAPFGANAIMLRAMLAAMLLLVVAAAAGGKGDSSDNGDGSESESSPAARTRTLEQIFQDVIDQAAVTDGAAADDTMATNGADGADCDDEPDGAGESDGADGADGADCDDSPDGADESDGADGADGDDESAMSDDEALAAAVPDGAAADDTMAASRADGADGADDTTGPKHSVVAAAKRVRRRRSHNAIRRGCRAKSRARKKRKKRSDKDLAPA
jgi:hypothetical protein